jgi:hypothetical protein
MTNWHASEVCQAGSMRTLLKGGRVIDPGTGHDDIGDLLIENGRVVAAGAQLSLAETERATVIDVSGCIVGPGFVDLHSHVHSIAGQRLQAMDGVTTALDLEAGLAPVTAALANAAREGRPLNYGFSASWAQARAFAHLGEAPVADVHNALGLLAKPEWQRSSTPRELNTWLAQLETEIADGALGIGILLGYAPRTDPAEFLAVARLAAAANAPTFTHVRELIEADPTTPIDGSAEVMIAAAETGAAMHHCHVNSTSRRHIDRVLSMLERSQAEGSRVTVETYPYGAGSTGVGAFFLAPERLGAWGIKPSDITIVTTGERVADAARLNEIRRTDPAAECVVAFLNEEDPSDRALLQSALAFPDAIVASDAMPVNWAGEVRESLQWPLPAGGATHPRTAGTFARSIRMMVRETGAWSWLEAFRRCSYLPARVLDDAASGARAKGHIGIGADADIVVIEPERFSDTASYLDSTRPSVGVRHLFVGGTAVVRGGLILADAFPGRALKGDPR